MTTEGANNTVHYYGAAMSHKVFCYSPHKKINKLKFWMYNEDFLNSFHSKQLNHYPELILVGYQPETYLLIYL